jgi:hypothetical protein
VRCTGLRTALTPEPTSPGVLGHCARRFLVSPRSILSRASLQAPMIASALLREHVEFHAPASAKRSRDQYFRMCQDERVSRFDHRAVLIRKMNDRS